MVFPLAVKLINLFCLKMAQRERGKAIDDDTWSFPVALQFSLRNNPYEERSRKGAEHNVAVSFCENELDGCMVCISRPCNSYFVLISSRTLGLVTLALVVTGKYKRSGHWQSFLNRLMVVEIVVYSSLFTNSTNQIDNKTSFTTKERRARQRYMQEV